MWVHSWREHLQSDSRVLVFTEEKQNGRVWVYAICRSSRACESLFADLMPLGTANATSGGRDTTPPTVTITGPTAGATVIRTSFVYVTATDNLGVVRVELYLDGQRIAVARAMPFTTRWRTHWYMFGGHTLQCKAYDAAGSVGISSPLTVNR